MSNQSFFATNKILKPETTSAKGFSIVELLMVVAVLGIMSIIAVMSFSAPKKYAPDDQALKILDIMQEARQKALSQRRVMRVEFNNSTKQVRLINEYDTKAMNASTGKNLINDSDDDKEIRSIPYDVKNLIIGTKPSNVTATIPTQSTPISEMSYSATTYPLSNGNSVFTLCFVKDGRVLSPGVNNLCEMEKDDPGGAIIYVHEIPDGLGISKIVRALTVSSVTGAAEVVKCELNSSYLCVKWIK